MAAIRLEDVQIEAIKPLCGTLRTANSISNYLDRYNWAETDIVICGEYNRAEETANVPILSIGVTEIRWREVLPSTGHVSGYVQTTANTERELRVDAGCPERYKTLAGELASRLSNQRYAPRAISTRGVSAESVNALAITTSGHPVALRCVRTYSQEAANNRDSNGITLVLPEEASLAEWFTVFLHDIHEIDASLVPLPPPRLLKPSDWYTPEERELESRIDQKSAQVGELVAEIEGLEAELLAASEKADVGIRRAIWADGDELESAAEDILADLGFTVQKMDEGLKPGEPKHEDLRLTRSSNREWEGIVEIKGYVSGIRTNDALQVRKHRDRYISEYGQSPDLTLWIVNPHRNDDPPSRPAADGNVANSAELIGAVCVQTTDLYRLWMSVAHGDLAAADAAQQLVDAAPGLWTLPPLQ